MWLRWSFVRQVMFRELLSTLRDPRTLVSTILLPLVMIPLFTVGFPALLGTLFSAQQETRQRLGVAGAALPDGLRARLTAETREGGVVTGAGVVLVPVADPLRAVQSGQVDAALSVPPTLPTEAGTGNGQVELYTKLSSLKSSAGVTAKVREAVQDYNQSLVTRKLAQLGLDRRVLTPVTTRTIDASTPAEQRSGQLAFIIPMFMLQFILAGATATAIDSTAGDKERGTLEALLVTPIRRTEVVTGKLIATTLFALLSAGLSLVGLLLAAPLALLVGGTGSRSDIARSFGGTLSVTPADLLILLLMLVSAALLISALLIAIAVHARSFKEAQTKIAPLTLLIVLPAVTLQFADFLTRSAALYAIPLVNAMLVILDTVKGSPSLGGAALAFGVNLAVTALVTLFAVRAFGREQVIFTN